jgi:nitrogen fixation protein NifB
MTTPIIDKSAHPCFNRKASGGCGRAHLPVAPRCNIQCNYCNRRYDCVNESRPGVTSAVLKPWQAVAYLGRVLESNPNIRVAGIAGPGDPMANPVETLETFRLVRRDFPHLMLCLSTNGLGALDYIDDLAALGLTHATVTMNAIDPSIAQRIYAWVRDGNVVYRNQAGVELLIQRQLAAIEGFVKRGISVKVNSIAVPGVNEHHIHEVAKTVAALGAEILNCIPLLPAAETPFAGLAQPSKELIQDIRLRAGQYLPQMTHCQRCRSDAVGLLHKDKSKELAPLLSACAGLAPAPSAPTSERPYVAVATREGVLVNQHLGEAKRVQIWRQTASGYELVETRATPASGAGPNRWENLARVLDDCRALLVAALGDSPRAILEASGVKPVECMGLIQTAVETVFSGRDAAFLKPRAKGLAAPCRGGGGGC